MPEPALGRRGAARSSMSIGEVLERLRPEFPEVSISKIRFLEEQGLVDPDRSPSGYRRFSPADLDRLRYVLSVQRDHYLPLRVIREHLEARDRGHDPAPLPGAPALPDPVRPHLVEAVPDVDLGRRELGAASGADERLIAELETYGLIQATPGTNTFDAEAVEVVRAAGELAAFGIEPRHLRMFRTAAEREAALVEQAIAPLRQQRAGRSPGRAGEAAREISSTALRLHSALLRSAIARGGD